MAALESESKVEEAKEEEKKLYDWIYNINSPDDREERENVPSSPEHTPEYLKIDGERSPYALAGEGLNMDAFDNVLRTPQLKVNVESLEEKPWRKAGADISDYFNYGFDEDTWKEYSKKQKKLHAINGKRDHNEIKVLVGHTRHGKEEPCFHPFERASSRESSAAIDVIEGHPGSNSRGQCLSSDGNNTQVVAEMSPQQLHSFGFFPHTHKYKQSFTSGGPSLSKIDVLDSWEEARRHRDSAARGQRCRSLQRSTGGGIEGRRRHTSRERRNSSRRHSRTRREDEDRDSQSRHRHKKAKRRRKDRESNEMLSAD